MTSPYEPEAKQAMRPQPPISVKHAMLLLMYVQATDPNRGRAGGHPNDRPLKNPHGFIGWGVVELAAQATEQVGHHVDPHEVTHALYDMRKQGWVKFNTTKSPALLKRIGEVKASGSHSGGTSGNGIPVRIQLTKQGQKEAERTLRRMSNAPKPEVPSPEVLSTMAQSGLTRTQAEELRSRPVPKSVKRNGRTDEDRVPLGEWPPVKAITFPTVWRTANAEELTREAAQLLNAAGQKDLAIMAEDALAERTPLEREVTRLVGVLVERGLLIPPAPQEEPTDN